MSMAMCTDELENSYIAVLRDIEQTGSTLRGDRPDAGLVLNNKKLDECLEQLDAYAEELHMLDQRLSHMVDSTDDVMARAENLPRYSALLQLGATGYDLLYQDYRQLRKLRERRNFTYLCAAVGAVTVTGCLVLLFA